MLPAAAGATLKRAADEQVGELPPAPPCPRLRPPTSAATPDAREALPG